jgi:hypothetical protein
MRDFAQLLRTSPQYASVTEPTRREGCAQAIKYSLTGLSLLDELSRPRFNLHQDLGNYPSWELIGKPFL